MKREKLIFVVVFMICSFTVGTVFAQYELQEPDWCVVDCGLNDTIGTDDYADGLDTGDSIGYRLDSSIGPLGEVNWEPALPSGTIVQSGFYHINYDATIENPTFVFSDTEISSTTIRFKLQSDNPDWTQYAIAFSTAVNPSDLFTGTTYYIKDGSIDWNPASFYEGVELTSLQPNTIYGFKIKSKSPPPELLSTDWSGNTDNSFWTHIETPGISVKVYITSATVTAVGPFTNLGEGLSGINYRIESQSWKGWTTNTSYAFTGLNDNTLYTFEVKARNGKPYETAVVSTSEYTLCGPPESPYIINVSSYSLTLGWSPSSLGAPEYYRIKENEVPIQDNYTQLSLDRDNLEYVNELYVYKIYAVNQADDTDEISSVSISTYTKCSIPPAPEILDVSADTIDIGINSGDNPYYTEYSIKVSGGGTDNFVQDDHTIGSSEVFNTNANWGVPSLTISTLLSNVEYDISVQAMNMYGHVTGYGASVSSCTYAIVPGLGVTEVLDSVTITIQEKNNSSQTEYAIQGYKLNGVWVNLGYLDTDESFYPTERWHTKEEWGSSGFTLSISDLGTYGYRFRAKARRTITGYSKEETGWSLYGYAGYVVDTPTAQIGLTSLNAGETVYYKDNQTVTFTSGGAEIRYTYKTDGSTPADPTLLHPSGPSLTLVANDGESKTYRIKARAWQGTLESDVGGVWIIVIDKDPPQITNFDIVEQGPITEAKINLDISATDASEMYIDGNVVNDINTFQWTGYDTWKIVYLTPGAGNKTVNLRVRDEAGNETSPVSDTIIYDPEPPKIIEFKINEGNYTDIPDINLIIEATSADSMKIDGQVEDDSVTKEWIPYSDVIQQVTLEPGDGEKTVTLTIRNDITGTVIGPRSDTITLDTTPPQNPTLILSDPDSPNPDYTNTSNVVVSITNLDTDVVEYILSETQATPPSATAIWWPVPITSTFDLLLPGDGPKPVYLWVRDIVGHINIGVSSTTIILDTQGPTGPSLSIDGGPYTNSPDVTLQISATGASDMWIDGDVIDNGSTKEWISYATSAQVTLTPGDVEKTVTIKFRDEAGNEISPISYAITLETTPPLIQGNIEAWFAEYNEELEESKETGCQTPTFVWTATDTASGIDGYSCSFSTDIGYEPNDLLDTTIDSTLLVELTPLDNDGTYYFKVKAKDEAGNFSGIETFAYNYKAEWGSPEATIDVENKKRIEDEVKGVERITLPEILFNEEVLGVQNNVEVELIRDNEGEDISGNVSCVINDEGGGLWKVDPGKDWGSNYTYRVKVKDGIQDKASNNLKEEKELIFTTMLDHTKRNVIMWESEGDPEDPKTKMILEANALKEDGYILINLEPLPLEKTGGAIEAKQVNPETIIEADEKMKNSGDKYSYNLRECMKEISGYTTEGGGMVIDKFLNSVYIEIPYGDENNNGIVDSTEGSSAPVSEKTLSVYWLDEEHRLWVKVAGTKVNTEDKIATAKVIGFGVYTLMGGGFYDLADAYAYPVPYKPNDGLSTTGDETSGITFTNLSTEAEIKIYTITGELVKKLIHKDGWNEEWYPVENEKGKKVVSGVYIYYIKNNKQHKSGKLVIIR